MKRKLNPKDIDNNNNKQTVRAPERPLTLPPAATAMPVLDGDVFDVIEALMALRLRQVGGSLMLRFRDQPSKQHPSTIVMAPAPAEMGYLTQFGLKVAMRERAACLALVKAHLDCLRDVELLLQNFGSCVRLGYVKGYKGEAADHAIDRIQAALSRVGSLSEEISQRLVHERGPMVENWKVSVERGTDGQGTPRDTYTARYGESE